MSGPCSLFSLVVHVAVPVLEAVVRPIEAVIGIAKAFDCHLKDNQEQEKSARTVENPTPVTEPETPRKAEVPVRPAFIIRDPELAAKLDTSHDGFVTTQEVVDGALRARVVGITDRKVDKDDYAKLVAQYGLNEDLFDEIAGTDGEISRDDLNTYIDAHGEPISPESNTKGIPLNPVVA